MSHVGRLVRTARQRRGMSRQALARDLGYRNLNKGARRVESLERDGECEPELFNRVAEALQLSDAAVRFAAELDERDRQKRFEAWVNEPVKPVLIARVVPGFFVPVSLPDDCFSHSDLERVACEYAKRHGQYVCLKLSRRDATWIGPDGQVYLRAEATADDSSHAGATLARRPE